MARPLIVQVFTVSRSLSFIHGQPAFMAQRGYDMQVVSAGCPVARAFADQQGIRHHAVPFTRRYAPGRDLWCLLQTYRLFRQLKPAIVHGNTPKAGLISMLAAWLAKVPVRVYELHGLPFESRFGLQRRGMILLEKFACRMATEVVAVSASVEKRALAKCIVPTAKIRVVHHGSCNGVDAVNRFNPARLDPQKLAELKASLHVPGRVIGFVGRLTRDKGIYELLYAWSAIRVAYPDVTLLLVGDPEPDFLSYSLLQNDDQIRAVGHVAEPAYYYALMDFLVLPTYREGFSTVLLEAAAMERPAVVSRVTGTVDVVADGQTGVFCKARSVNSLAHQLRWYLDNPALIQEHGQRARQHVLTKFVPSDIWTAKWQLYECLLAQTSSSVDRATAT